MENVDIKQVLGTAGAGAIGFAAGFYAGFFLILSVWGLEFEGDLFPVITIGFGSVLAGIAMAFTVKKSRRRQAVLTSVVLGALLIAVVVAFAADVGVIALGGVLLVVFAGILVRTGITDGLLGSS